MSLQVFCFSPTGGTRRVTEVAASAWPERAVWHDLGSRSFPASLALSPADTCIIASPCFSGRVPPVAAERIASLRGNGARALVISVFGGRAFEDSLLELTDLAAGAGFQVVGAAAVCAQHSLAPRVAAGRPDSRDLAEMADFARRVAAYRGQGSAKPQGYRPYRPYNRLGYAPAASRQCTFCLKCADACPVGAIQRRPGVPADMARCTGCMTCVRVCPGGCRQLPELVRREIGARLEKSVSGRARNAFFLAA